LKKPSTNLNIKNHKQKLAYDLACSEEIQGLFDAFMKEKSLLEGDFRHKIAKHSMLAKNISKMFELSKSKKISPSPDDVMLERVV